MSKIKQFFRQSGLTKAQLLASALCYFLCFALFLGIVVIWNPLSLSSTPTEDSQAADGPTNTSGYWTDTGRYDISWYNNPDTDTYGDGTAENPYKISTAAQLAGLSWLVYTKGQEGNPLVSGTDYSGSYIFRGKYFKQTVDIDLSAYYWQPIGIRSTREGTSRLNYFSGSYDGGNHTVSGVFTPAGDGDGYSYQGLFGYVYSFGSSYRVTIQNVGITNSFIQGSYRVGGVVGYADASSGSITITNCYNTGSVTSTWGSVGGVVGDATTVYFPSSATITISNCYNTGAVTSTATSNSFVGGVVGDANFNTTITNCYNTGDVTGTATSYSYVGGVVGYAGLNATITNCYNTGSVSGSQYVGGVVGYASSSSSSSSATITITNCYNTGSVTGSGSYFGGVVGNADASSGSITIINCYYGASCDSTIGGVNGEDTDGQAKYSSALTVDTPKDISWYTTSSNWDPTYPWDFEEIWILDQGRNDGYPSFIIDYWISDPSYYSIEWFNNPDTETYGDGSEANPYIIDSAEDLAGLSWLVYTKGQADNPLVSGTDYSGDYIFRGKFFKQTANIDLSAYYWQPIGITYTRDGATRYNYFSGSYDGGNYTVSGIFTPAGTTNAYSYQGLFGYVRSQSSSYPITIKNIGVSNSFIQGYRHVGGVVGYAYVYSGTITIINCYNTGVVSGSGESVGGVVGSASAYYGTITITNCYNTGSVSGSSNYVGGVVGNATGTITITNCYNTGDVTSTATSNSYVGGVVGFANASSSGTITITNCFNTGDVTSTATYNSHVGGVVGYASAPSGSLTITNCYNTGSVTSTATSYSGVGGVVGGTSSTSSGTITITNCYYGANCPKSVGGINGADETDQAEFDPNIETNAKTLLWYTNSSNWNSSHRWDFENVWQINASLNDGYPAFLYQEVPIDWWTNEGNYSIEWYNNSDTTTYGDGSAENPYKISTAADLAGLSYLVYNNAVDAADATQDVGGSAYYIFSNAYFEQTENIDLSAHVWQPIGIYYDRTGTQTEHYFSGNYDGGGYTVSGINTPAGDTDAYSYQGLFGYVHRRYNDDPRFIENLGITDSNIQGYNYVGGIVGYLYSTGVSNTYNSALVSASGNYVGGIAGWARPNNGVPIQKSYSTGSISGVNYVGGITGEFNTMDGGYMSAVFNRGSVTGTNYVGGISGSTADIYEAYNTGTVSGSDYVGGIMYGRLSSGGSASIIAAFNVGQVISSGTNVDPIIVSVDGSVSQTYYGGPSLSEVAGANGTYIADLDTQAKTLTFLRDTLGFDFGTKWQMDTENVNDGYPIFRFDSDTWIGTGNYSTTLLGSGTAQEPYQIWSAKDLAAIAYALQSGEFNGETLTPDVDETMGINVYFSGVYFEQKADIDLSAHYWEPIGSMVGAITGGSMTGFGGQYDGGNFEILGLRSLRGHNAQAGEGVSSSLFGLLVGDSTSSEKTAQIKNVHLTDADLSVDMYSGAIAGVALNARIENCSVAGKYSATVTGSGGYNGGMVGMAMMSEIDNCINYCEQTVLMNSSSYYGGIVGASQMSTITNCKNFGDSITVAGGYVGGILGQSQPQDTISNCENYADFVQTEAFDSLRTLAFAGIVPDASGATISGCLNYGTVALQSTIVPSSGATLAGIVATAEGNTTIANCANFGLIDGGASEMVAPAGIVGALTASQITNTSNFGPVNGIMAAGVVMAASGNCSITGCNNYGTVTGDMLASGILGGSFTTTTASITDCANFGTLNASTILAGIIGMIGKSGTYIFTISNCVADFTTQSSSTPYISGIYATVIDSGFDLIEMTIDKCSVNLKIDALSASSYNVFADMTQQSDIYSITTTNSYGTVSVNGAIEARALTEDTSAMEGNFVYLAGLNDGRPLPIKTDGSYFFHQHTFGATTGILDQINDLLFPNLLSEQISFNTTYWDISVSELPTVTEDMWQQVSLGLVVGKTYSIEMTIDGTSVSTTATAIYQDSDAAPSSAITFGDSLNLTVNGVGYFFMIVENATLNDAGAFIYTPGQTILFAYGGTNNTVEGATINPSVPVVITAIREVAT